MLTENFWRRLPAALLALALLGLSTRSVARNVPYVVAFQPVNSVAEPFGGTMRLSYNHGIISGTYNDMSTQPYSPFANRLRVAVSGGVDSNGAVTLVIGALSFHGTLKGQWMSGTATIGGRIYTFQARQGAPGKPAP